MKLTIETLKKLISERKLGVKFNKSKIKDHGTIWHYNENQKKSKEMKKNQDDSNDDSDFFREI